MEKSKPETAHDCIDTIAFALAKLIGMYPEEASEAQRSDDTVHIYVVGCAGLGRIARQAGRHICKIGTTTHPDIEARLTELGRDNYAAFSRPDAEISAREPGFSRWIAKAITTTRLPSNPAIEIRPRALKIKLPTGLTRRQFDVGLRRALMPWRRALLDEKLTRWTAYDLGQMRWSKADELYVFDPSKDGDLLLGLVEGILAGNAVVRQRRTPT